MWPLWTLVPSSVRQRSPYTPHPHAARALLGLRQPESTKQFATGLARARPELTAGLARPRDDAVVRPGAEGGGVACCPALSSPGVRGWVSTLPASSQGQWLPRPRGPDKERGVPRSWAGFPCAACSRRSFQVVSWC